MLTTEISWLLAEPQVDDRRRERHVLEPHALAEEARPGPGPRTPVNSTMSIACAPQICRPRSDVLDLRLGEFPRVGGGGLGPGLRAASPEAGRRRRGCAWRERRPSSAAAARSRPRRTSAAVIASAASGVEELPRHRRALFRIARVALVMPMDARDGVDVAADLERIANALALELRGELGRLDREIPVRARDGRRRSRRRGCPWCPCRRGF